MDDAWLGLGVAALVVLVLLAAVVYDLRARRPARPGDVSDEALRRLRRDDERNQGPPTTGTLFP